MKYALVRRVALAASVGNYFDNSFTSHGFGRQPNGHFTEFTPPKLSQIFLFGINDSGQVVGNGNLTRPPIQE